MSNLPKIIDNDRHVLLSTFHEISSKHDHLSIATGYWDLKGMQSVFDVIKNYKKIRLLIGREPLIPRHKENRPEPDYPDKDFFNDLEQMQPNEELKNLVSNIKQLIKDGKLEVKVYRKNFLHAKCYIFGDYSSENAVGIIGSSNFTQNGLTYNTELNALESDHRIVTFKPQTKKQEVGHLYWFDQFWNDPQTEEWNGKFIELLEQSPVGDKLFSPYETYIKTLYELYKEELLEEDLETSIKGSHDLFDFQKKNVQALLRRLKKYKVAMLADSVGLGKTYTAIEVMKHYLDGEQGKKRIEVICPKSLKSQWMHDLSTQGIQNFNPITLQNPQEIKSKMKLDDIASVSLFVIDESHNLKNRAGKRFEQILDWIKGNKHAHVLLLTATPINNQLSDISNQILLGARGNSDLLKITSIDRKLKHTVQIDFIQAMENLKKKMNQDFFKKGDIDYENVREVMAPILRAFVVRRTRQGIENEYGSLIMDCKERKFPEVIPDVSNYGFNSQVASEVRSLSSNDLDLKKIYRLSPETIFENTKDLKHPLDQLSGVKELYDDKELSEKSAIHFVYQIILLVGFVPYRWKMYQTKYYGKTRKQIKEMKLPSKDSKLLFLQLGIYGILRTMFLKRLESSVYAFKASLGVYKRKLDVFERGLDSGKIVSLKDLRNIENQLRMGDEDIDPEDLVIDEEAELDTVDSKKYNLEALKKDIQKEKQLIEFLEAQVSILEKDDSKIKAFAKLLDNLNKTKPAGSKVLVFSFYADTVNYLQENLSKYAKSVNSDNTGFLSSKNRANAENLADRFSPKSKGYTLKDDEKELDCLISTDILSEGQNLQDCGVLINYDLHWNPVRMIQRNGRINRIGTIYPKVYIYNISPEAHLEEYLKLVQRLEGKINLIKNTIGTDTPVLDEKENPLEFKDNWHDIYSDSLQKRMEALKQSERDSDFLLSEDEYISDLKVFHLNSEIEENYKKLIYGIAMGKWALMPKNNHRGDVKQDVLVLNSLFDQDGSISGHTFVSMKKDGSNFKAVSQLQALEWIKTIPDDNESVLDKISLDKIAIAQKTDNSVESYLDKEEGTAPVGQERDVQRIMFENHFPEQDIKQVRDAFQTANVIDKQKITRLVRKIVRAKREDQPYLNDMKELVKIAYKTFENKEDIPEIDQVKQVLFYVKNNE